MKRLFVGTSAGCSSYLFEGGTAGHQMCYSTLQAASCEMLKEVDAVHRQPFGYRKVHAVFFVEPHYCI